MSIFKVPHGVLKVMESIRARFFNGADQLDNKIAWVAWDKILASKKNGGLGVICAIYGTSVETHRTHYSSNWCSILREVHKLKGKGFDFWSHVKKRIGNGADTRFWFDQWLGDSPLCVKYPRLFALEMDKHASVESKLHSSVSNSFRRMVRGGIEQHMLVDLHTMLDSVSLSNSNDRWVFDLVSDGSFRVKETRNFIDNTFLPAQKVATRWVNFVPIKVNVFFWRVRLNCLPTRVNLVRRGINVESFYGVFVSGGTYLRQVGIRFKIGSLGFFRSGFPTRLNLCWKTLSMLLGGRFGVDVIRLFHGRTGLKTLILFPCNVFLASC
ncbi:hypothetical protein Tco_0552960 [Tanacetum coccineum]